MEPCRRKTEREERAARAAAYQEAAWVDGQRQAAERGAGGPDVDSASASNGDGDGDGDDAAAEAATAAGGLYCLACDKLFRSANALANHERCAARGRARALTLTLPNTIPCPRRLQATHGARRVRYALVRCERRRRPPSCVRRGKARCTGGGGGRGGRRGAPPLLCIPPVN